MTKPRSWMIDKALLSLKSLILVLCLFVTMSGHYPPVFAQKTHPQQHTPSVEDTQQDDSISALNKHLEADDAAIKAMQDSIAKLSADVSIQQGEERGVGVVLTILSIAGIFLQLMKPKQD